MMSLRLCVLFLALAASSLGDNTSRLPFKVSVGYGCSGVVVSRNQILSVGQCALSTGGVDIKKGTQSHDSGEIYFLNRIVYHPQIHDYEQKMDYVLYTVDRDIEAEEGFEPAELPAGNVTLTEGQICTTLVV
ncbi:trypsin-7-like [Phlebotomus argentipes]|uniref:trypsin-7-like n=1 Tax=Phlebotomus argentipes TaxID=94469 RepID=UPI002892F8E8|nr:trypsin-7-like [Phlebotomus argentipes]